MSLRIRFVEPRPPGRNVYDHILLPRLGLPLMATMLAEGGHDTGVFCEMLGPIDLGECLAADLVGISGTTSTQPAGYALADELSAAGVAVVLGGSHVSFRVEEALEHAPYVVRGEGQQTIVELVAALERGTALGGIAGLSWRDNLGRAHHNPARSHCSQTQFERLPIPDLSLIEGHERLEVKPAMTQWGCPYDCEFCSVTAQFSRVVRHRRTDQVLAELAGLSAGELFFHDDNFVVNKRRTAELLRGMVDAGLTPSFAAQMRADTVLRSRTSYEIDHEFLELLRQAGCAMAMVGFESISEENLASIGKRTSVAVSEQAVRAFHRHGIAVHGMFVVGLDFDDASSAQATAAFARRLGIDTFQLMMVTPAPGTRLWERLESEGRLIEADWTFFDGHHAVLRPERMTPLELQLSALDAMRRFYSRSAIAGPALRGILRHLPELLGIVTRHAGGLVRSLGREALGPRQRDATRADARSLDPAASSAPVLSRALTSVASSLTRDERARLEAALGVAALRLYGRRRVAEFWDQDHSRSHTARLATLT
ncbi:MAG TPA: radical SAM protein [Solirubrobacteraceae bacterium]|nr:radical SAM protein [Solirubrobacteraceae bacterium]